MLNVGVAGALGRMGRLACTALSETDDLRVCAGFDRARAGEPIADVLGLPQASGHISDTLDAFFAAKLDVVVDFTTYPVTREVAMAAIRHGVSPVIGATGWTEPDILALRMLARDSGVGAMLVPNFAVGAVLMMRFAAEAARFFPTVEIIELHHDAKIDKPSGTAKLTAARLAEAGHPAVPIHSVRLRGLVAHQEVLLGGRGETLTIRHDSLSRESFADGILAAVRFVVEQNGLIVGLDRVLDRGAQGQTPYDAKPVTP